MANSRLIKRRMGSAQNITQITRAMQMVAASKMKKAQNQALAGEPYSEKLQAVLASLLTGNAGFKHSFLQANDSPETALLLITTNKGLCGGLNTNHFRQLHPWFKKTSLDHLRFVTVGKKGRDLVLRTKGNLAADFSDLPENFTFEDTLPISHLVINLFKEKTVCSVVASYADFISTLVQRPKKVQLLPITQEAIFQSLGELGEGYQKEGPQFEFKEYIIEPSPAKVINWLLPYFIELEVYHFLLEAKASEHSSRMVAMKSASENAKELVSQLRLEYNKIRQQLITSEISDIVTARKALKQ